MDLGEGYIIKENFAAQGGGWDYRYTNESTGQTVAVHRRVTHDSQGKFIDIYERR